MYDDEMKAMYPQLTDRDLEMLRDGGFPTWFHNYISSGINDIDP